MGIGVNCALLHRSVSERSYQTGLNATTQQKNCFIFKTDLYAKAYPNMNVAGKVQTTHCAASFIFVVRRCHVT